MEACPRNIANSLLWDMLYPRSTMKDVIQNLGAIQIDPVSIVAPNHYLVIHGRIKSITQNDIEQTINNQMFIEVYAHQRCLVPINDFPLYWPKMLEVRHREKDHFESYKPLIKKVLTAIELNGPMSTRDFEESSYINKKIHNSWGPRRIVTKVLDLLWRGGYLAVAYRQGNNKYYDLIENLVPPEILKKAELSPEEIRLLRWQRYIQSVRITDVGDPNIGFERLSSSLRKKYINTLLSQERAKFIQIKGVRGTYVAASDFTWELPKSPLSSVLLPPLDNLLWRRKRLEDFWAFNYRWEIYTPPVKRTVGPYGMPLISGHQILGNVMFNLIKKQGFCILEQYPR